MTSPGCRSSLNAICGTPTRSECSWSRRPTWWPCAGLRLAAGLFGAEPWSGEFRGRIEELLGLRALDGYGLSEVIGPGVAAECLEAADGLHVNEDHFLPEALDPATGAPVPEGTP